MSVDRAIYGGYVDCLWLWKDVTMPEAFFLKNGGATRGDMPVKQYRQRIEAQLDSSDEIWALHEIEDLPASAYEVKEQIDFMLLQFHYGHLATYLNEIPLADMPSDSDTLLWILLSMNQSAESNEDGKHQDDHGDDDDGDIMLGDDGDNATKQQLMPDVPTAASIQEPLPAGTSPASRRLSDWNSAGVEDAFGGDEPSDETKEDGMSIARHLSFLANANGDEASSHGSTVSALVIGNDDDALHQHQANEHRESQQHDEQAATAGQQPGMAVHQRPASIGAAMAFQDPNMIALGALGQNNITVNESSSQEERPGADESSSERDIIDDGFDYAPPELGSVTLAADADFGMPDLDFVSGDTEDETPVVVSSLVSHIEQLQAGDEEDNNIEPPLRRWSFGGHGDRTAGKQGRPTVIRKEWQSLRDVTNLSLFEKPAPSAASQVPIGTSQTANNSLDAGGISLDESADGTLGKNVSSDESDDDASVERDDTGTSFSYALPKFRDWNVDSYANFDYSLPKFRSWPGSTQEDDSKKESENSKKKQADLQAELDRAKKELADTNAQGAQEVQNMKEERDRVQQQLTDTRDELRTAWQQVETKKNSEAHLRSELKEKKGELATAEMQRDEYQVNLRDAQATLNQRDQQLQAMTTERNTALDTVNDLRRRLLPLDAAQGGFHRQLAQVASLQQQLATANTKVNRLQSERDETNRLQQANDLQQQNATLTAARDAARTEAGNLRRQAGQGTTLAQLEASINNLLQQFNTLGHQVTQQLAQGGGANLAQIQNAIDNSINQLSEQVSKEVTNLRQEMSNRLALMRRIATTEEQVRGLNSRIRELTVERDTERATVAHFRSSVGNITAASLQHGNAVQQAVQQQGNDVLQAVQQALQQNANAVQQAVQQHTNAVLQAGQNVLNGVPPPGGAPPAAP